MKFYVMTLFPQMILDGLITMVSSLSHDEAIKEIEKHFDNWEVKKLINLNAINIRDFSGNKHGQVDDYPYGGGAGMVMQAGPVCDAYESIAAECKKRPRVVYMTPQGHTFNQSMAEEFAKEEELVILCGHYEGIDQRVIDKIVDEEISIGDYVLTGGELPAMVLIDAVSRYNEGVLSKESIEEESFSNRIIRISAVYKT